MRTLEQLRQALDLLLAKMEALEELAVGENGESRTFTEEEQKRWNSLETEGRTIKAEIDRLQEREILKQESTRLSAAASPSLRVVREDKHDEDGNYRGYAPIQKGGLGEMLSDVAAVANGRGESQKLKELRAATGANEGVGSQGGFLAQSDHAQQLVSQVMDAGNLASRCTPINLSSNSTTITLLDETSLAKGSIYGGVQAYFRAEAGTVTATKPKFKQVNVKAEALEALFYATDELLEDTSALESFANLAFTNAMSVELDDAILNGNGVGKPQGILGAPGTITIAKENGQTAATVVYANIDAMNDRLLTGSEGSAIWLVHPDVPRQLRNAITTPGSKTDFMPLLAAYGIGGSPEALKPFGRSLVKSQVCQALGTKGDILLGDFSKYFLFKKSGIAASQSVHVAFLTGEKVFKWTMRVNGMPLLGSPITDMNGSTTRAPFITLATRS